MNKKISLLIISFLTIFLATNLIISFLITNTAKQLKQELFQQNFTQAQITLQTVQTQLNILPYTTLGLTKLPPLTNVYNFANQTIITTQTSLDIAKNLKFFYTNSENLDQEINIQQLSLNLLKLQQDFNSLNQYSQNNIVRSLINQTVNLDQQKQTEMFQTIDKNLSLLQELNQYLPTLLGMESPQRYRVMLQNNMELRPTGGFMGSYIELVLNKGKLTHFEIQDIYVPDGQLLQGYIKQPEPIEKYLFNGGTPGWKLRDANWDPDFTQSAKTIDWFFQKGGYPPADAYISFNLLPIMDIIKLIEPVSLPDYDVEITTDNFYSQAQYYAETDFFPGSTQKKDFLSSIGNHIIFQLSSDPAKYFVDVSQIILNNLDSNQISIAHFEPHTASFFHNKKWDGSILPVTCPQEHPDCTADYLYLNEANLGVNKANCCIERKVEDNITQSKNKINHNLNISYTNNNPKIARKPYSWGDKYENYLRVYLPKDADIKDVSIGELKVTNTNVAHIKDKLELGIYLKILGQSNQTLTIKYSIPIREESNYYSLQLQKQSGVKQLPLEFSIFGEPISETITQNTQYLKQFK